MRGRVAGRVDSGGGRAGAAGRVGVYGGVPAGGGRAAGRAAGGDPLVGVRAAGRALSGRHRGPRAALRPGRERLDVGGSDRRDGSGARAGRGGPRRGSGAADRPHAGDVRAAAGRAGPVLRAAGRAAAGPGAVARPAGLDRGPSRGGPDPAGARPAGRHERAQLHPRLRRRDRPTPARMSRRPGWRRPAACWRPPARRSTRSPAAAGSARSRPCTAASNEHSTSHRASTAVTSRL